MMNEGKRNIAVATILLIVNYIPLSYHIWKNSITLFFQPVTIPAKPTCYTCKLCFVFARIAKRTSSIAQIFMFFSSKSFYVFFHVNITSGRHNKKLSYRKYWSQYRATYLKVALWQCLYPYHRIMHQRHTHSFHR